MTNVVKCSRTLAVHFPPAVYRAVGSSQVLPELAKSLDITNVQCIQFVPNGVVRVTYKESAQCDAALVSGVSFRGTSLRATPVDARTRLVYLRDLPAEVPDDPVRAFFRKFGVLHSLSPQFHPGWPDVKNGTRVAKVTLTKDLPSSVRIAGFDARLWYQGQPQSCPVCRQFGHRVRDCPLNGLCRRCQQPGHMARECSSRRPNVVPESTDPVPSDPAAVVNHTMSDDEDDPDYVLSSASEPGSCSGDEEVLRSIPTSVLAARARKRPAPPAVPSDESSVDLRDNELSPASTVDPVPGTPESASAVVSDPVPGTPESASAVVSDPVPGTPESASAVVPAVPDPVSGKPESPAPKSKKKRRPAVASSPAKSAPVHQSTTDQSTPVQSSPVDQSSPVRSCPLLSTPADQPTPPEPTARRYRRKTYWEASRRTGFGRNVEDGTGATVYLDFGRFSRAVQCDSTTFEFDRFVKYVHHDVGRKDTFPVNPAYLKPGTPLAFPKPPK